MIALCCVVCGDEALYDDYAVHCINCGAYISRRLMLIHEAERLSERLLSLYHEHRHKLHVADPLRRKSTNYSQNRIAHVYERALLRLTRRLGNDDFVGYPDTVGMPITGVTVRL